MKKFIILLFSLCLFITNIKADCNDKNLIEWSSDLDTVFTMYHYNDHQDLDEQKYQYSYFLSLSKNRDDVYFTVRDNQGNAVTATKYEEIDLYAVGCFNGMTEETYTIEVYGSEDSACPNELIKKMTYTVEAYNEYYKTEFCEKYPDHELCGFYNNKTQNMSRTEFNKIMQEYENEQNRNSNWLYKIFNFLSKIWIYLVCAIVPIVGVSIYYKTKIKKINKVKIGRKERYIKKTKLFIFFLLMSLLFVNRVDAALVCSGSDTIYEGAIKAGGWKADLTVCILVKDRDVAHGGFGSYAAASAWAHTKVQQDYIAADGKSAGSIFVERCNEGKYSAVETHTYTYTDYYEYNGSYYPYQTSGECTVSHSDISGEVTSTTCHDCASNALACIGYKIEYTVTCPGYKCSPQDQIISGYCTPTFSINGNTAYCINPSNPFPGNTSNNYQETDFDATKCVSSNSTPDCGYANILIEGAYNGYTDAAINYALRIWGAYTGAAGYSGRLGLAYVQGDDCGTYYAFPEQNNVYKDTYAYIKSKYLESLRDDSVFETTSTTTGIKSLLNNETCVVGQKHGVGCDENNNYTQAFALFFSSVLGNKDMQKHLGELFDSQGTEPTSSSVAGEEENEWTLVKTEYNETITSGVRVDCEPLITKKKNGDTLTDEESRVYPYCLNEVTHVIGIKSDGTYIDVATKKPITDLNGDGVINDSDFLLLPDPTEGFKYTYCQKNACFVETSYFAICDEDAYTEVKTLVKYNKSPSQNAVKKYAVCGSSDYQVMFAFHKKEGSTTTETKQETVVNVNYVCRNSACTNYNLRTNLEEDTCNDESGGYSTKFVKDPPVECILNMGASSTQNSYDYSDYFGVNSDFCKIYCSDSVEYYTADKVDIYSGLSFKLDIEYKRFKANRTAKPISNLVLMKRTCVSKIFYDNNEIDHVVDWASRYDGVDNSSIHSWKDLYNQMKKYGESDSHINEILYDLYNCNLYSNIPVSKPRNNTIGNVYNRILEIYSEKNSYGFNGTSDGFNQDAKLSSTENNVAYSYIKYGGGAYKSGTQNRVASEYNDVKLSHVLTDHTGNKKGVISDIKYCTGTECFQYDVSNEYKMPEELGETSNRKISTTQGSGIPSHDYAYFTITSEIDFYNSSKYQVEPYTGDVIDITNTEENENYTTLDDYLYPTASDANVTCKNGTCVLAHKLSVNYTFYRKSGNGTNSFKKAISNIEQKCSIKYNATPYNNNGSNGKDELVYRNIDLKNFFPSSRAEGDNWSTSIAQDYLTRTENYVINNGEYQYYQTHLEYSYSLTQDAIKKVREYNQEKQTFNDDSIIESSCSISDGKYFNCQSSFISELEDSANSYGIVNERTGEIRGISKYTQELKD